MIFARTRNIPIRGQHFGIGLKQQKNQEFPNSKNAPRHIETGQKGYLMPSNTNIPTVLQKVIIIKSRY